MDNYFSCHFVNNISAFLLCKRNVLDIFKRMSINSWANKLRKTIDIWTLEPMWEGANSVSLSVRTETAISLPKHDDTTITNYSFRFTCLHFYYFLIIVFKIFFRSVVVDLCILINNQCNLQVDLPGVMTFEFWQVYDYPSHHFPY